VGTVIERDDNGKPITPELRLYNLGVDKLKRIGHDRLPVDDGGPGQCHFPNDASVRHLNELFAEKEIDGKWVKGDSPNEGLDLFGYCEAGRQMLDPDRKGRGWGTENIPVWAKPVRLTKGPEKLPMSPPAGVSVKSQTQDNALSILQQLMSLNGD
jgi:phage terminase large subunit GpA-like protein